MSEAPISKPSEKIKFKRADLSLPPEEFIRDLKHVDPLINKPDVCYSYILRHEDRFLEIADEQTRQAVCQQFFAQMKTCDIQQFLLTLRKRISDPKELLQPNNLVLMVAIIKTLQQNERLSILNDLVSNYLNNSTLDYRTDPQNHTETSFYRKLVPNEKNMLLHYITNILATLNTNTFKQSLYSVLPLVKSISEFSIDTDNKTIHKEDILLQLCQQATADSDSTETLYSMIVDMMEARYKIPFCDGTRTLIKALTTIIQKMNINEKISDTSDSYDDIHCFLDGCSLPYRLGASASAIIGFYQTVMDELGDRHADTIKDHLQASLDKLTLRPLMAEKWRSNLDKSDNFNDINLVVPKEKTSQYRRPSFLNNRALKVSGDQPFSVKFGKITLSKGKPVSNDLDDINESTEADYWGDGPNPFDG